jgi:hypothetical protein
MCAPVYAKATWASERAATPRADMLGLDIARLLALHS